MKLYELKGAYLDILNKLGSAESEDEARQIRQELANIKDAVEVKLDNCGKMYRSLLAEADVYQSEVERLKRKADILSNQAEGLKNYIALVLQPGNRVKTPLFDFSWRKSQSVEIEDLEALPEAYKRTRVISEPDKNLIKSDLQIGAEIPGAKLIDKLNLQIK